MSETTSVDRKDLLPPVYLTSDPPLIDDKEDGFYCRVNLVSKNDNNMPSNGGGASMQKTVKCRYEYVFYFI